MKIAFEPSIGRGEIALPPSKSIAQRAIIAAAMAEGTSVLFGLCGELCDDIRAALGAVRDIGAAVRERGDAIEITGRDLRTARKPWAVDCGESATAMRLLIPPLLLAGNGASIRTHGSLTHRQHTVYEDTLAPLGVRFFREGDICRLEGKLTGGTFPIRADRSSQFLSGLLFALPLTEEGGTLLPQGEIVSRPYIEMTREVLAAAGIRSAWIDGEALAIPGKQRFLPFSRAIPSDASAKIFADALNAFSGRIGIRGSFDPATQHDAIGETMIRTLKEKYAEFDLSQTPDLAPMLFAFAGIFHGGRFTGTGRLKNKESDRIAAMKTELEKCGIPLYDRGESVEIGAPNSRSFPHAAKTPLNGHGDHRVVMALSVLLSRLGGEIEGAEAVTKSDPSFFPQLQKAGISLSMINPSHGA